MNRDGFVPGGHDAIHTCIHVSPLSIHDSLIILISQGCQVLSQCTRLSPLKEIRIDASNS